jgi:integrating conjugative element relaxase (TIGR03760 family)
MLAAGGLMPIRFLTRSKQQSSTAESQVVKSEYEIVTSGQELLRSADRQALIRKIKRLFSVTDDVWNHHYLYAIQQFAELAQGLPASEVHHHSVSGGLVDHTLECLHIGCRVAQGYVLPPSAEPEEISKSVDRWRFGVFITILAHDLGKVVTDVEVVYREDGREFERWHPWYNNMPIGAEYTYRYRSRLSDSKSSKSLHEKSSMSLLPRILTKQAAVWLFEDPELLSQIFSTVSHSSFGGQTIAEIVRIADSTSVGSNLGATTGVRVDHSASVPLHEKLIVCLRNLINEGELKKNRPGAAVWVTETETFAVSKATMEAVRLKLVNEGHSGIPKNAVRLFEILKDHELLIPTADDESVWTAEVNDFAKNWQQKLTFLRFKNEVIWTTSSPPFFDGEVNICDESHAEELNRSSKCIAGEGREAQMPLARHESAAKPAKPETVEPGTAKPETAKPGTAKPGTAKPETAKPGTAKPGTVKPETVKPEAVNAELAQNRRELLTKKGSRRGMEATLMQDDFISWLINGIQRRKIRVNEPKAPVHVLDDYVAIVTPAIFNLYLDKNSLKRRLYEKRSAERKPYTFVQRELESLDVHCRGANGQNIVRMVVEGQRSKSELRVYLLDRQCFPSLSAFTSNKAMAVDLSEQ